MAIALYAGSFDPITNGHIDIINTASKMFDKVIVAVAINENKNPFLPVDIRLELIKKAISDIPNVEAVSYKGLTVNYAEANCINVLIRGVRSVNDFDYEMSLASINKQLNNNIDTCLLFASQKNQFISSSAVKEMLNNNANIKDFVPASVYEYLRLKD